MIEPDYIGDGVYVSFDGYHIWLKTQREEGEWHTIALEPSVLEALNRYAKRIVEAAKSE